MASNLLKLHIHSFHSTNLSNPFAQNRIHFSPSPPLFLKNLISHPCSLHVSSFPLHISFRPKSPPLIIYSSSTPPTSKEEAILQAKTCLSTTLEKALNNPKLIGGRLKKLKQPRFQVEIPVIDDSPESLPQLAYDVFKDLPIRRKGSPVNIVILWPSPLLKNTATEAFQTHSLGNVDNVDISSVRNGDIRVLGSAEVAVFMAPESSQLPEIKAVSESFHPKPVVMFNPRWDFDEENGFGGLNGFVGSFEVIYSFMGLEVRGILSKRKGVVFKCVRDGVLSGEKWNVFVEEEGGELRVVSKFKARPSIGEVENVLYNLMAINSPITKSAKFLRDLVSNVTGKRK